MLGPMLLSKNGNEVTRKSSRQHDATLLVDSGRQGNHPLTEVPAASVMRAGV